MSMGAINYFVKSVTSFVKRAYKASFQIFLGDQDKKWSFYIVYYNYEKMLRDLTKRKRKLLLLKFPWFGGNPEITYLSAIFLWSTRKVLAKKVGIRSPIEAFPQPFDRFHICKELPVPVFSGFFFM